MGLFGLGKKKGPALSDEGLDVDMDVPPKPPEFHIEGPASPTPDELNPIEEIQPITPPEAKPVHVDDLGIPAAQPELPPLEPQHEVRAAIQSVRSQVPPELPQLSGPLTHEEYAIIPEPGPREVEMPPYTYPDRPLGESVLLREEGPLFLTLEGYEKIITNAVKIRADLQQMEDRTVGLNANRNREDALYAKFQQSLEHIERKLSYIDRMLFGESEE